MGRIDIEKDCIRQLVIECLSGGEDNLINQPFSMYVEEVNDIIGNGKVFKGKAKILTGRISSGKIKIEEELLCGASIYKVFGIEMFGKILEEGECGDHCGIILQDDEAYYFGIEEGIYVTKYCDSNLRINWKRLVALVEERYGLKLRKRDFTRRLNPFSVAELIDTIYKICLERQTFSSSVAGNHLNENVGSSLKMNNIIKEDIEDKYNELRNLLNQAKKEVSSINSKHKSISKLQQSMKSALQEELENLSLEVDNAMNFTSWDNLVIAFFGETNAGKSTIIETFRILFEQNREKGQDGLIVGDGRQDFTQDYHEYKMSIGGKPFTLIDVPGIEGNEADFRDVIKQALNKAHCVFYVQGHNKKPDSATAEKIKTYLGDWVNVYSIQNVRGGISNYDEEEERETLLTSGVLKNEKLIKETFLSILGDVYKGNITLQALLAMCAKASFSDKRDDLQRNQQKLLTYFGSPEEVLRFSQFSTIRQLVEEKSSCFTDEITEANKQKMISLANKTACKLEEILLGDDIDVSTIEQKLRDFRRNVLQILTSTQTNIEQKLPNIVRTELSKLKTELYGLAGQGHDSLKERGQMTISAATQQIKSGILRTIQNEIVNASNKIDNKKKELPSVKLKSNFNVNINVDIEVDLDEALEELGMNLDKIGSFALGTASMAAVGAGLGTFIPGVGTLIGAGVGALAGIISGASRDGGRAEAKKYILESIDEAESKCLSQLRLQINNIKRDINREQRILISEIDKEIDTIGTLTESSFSLKGDIKKFIKGLKNAKYGTV